MDSSAQLVSDLTYLNYAHNRRISPDVSPERWARIYGADKVNSMEARFQSEAEREPRFQKQQAIESAIMAFRPDFCEASAILDALTARLARRYDPSEYAAKDRELIEAVFSAGDAFRKALDDADETVPQ